MSKSILLVGATGFVGGKILNLIDDGNSKITLLSRKKLNHNQILNKSLLILMTLMIGKVSITMMKFILR